MLVATMLAVAAVDFLIPLLADWVRWVLSAVAYTAVVGIVWRQCLQQLLHAPDERQIARLVEHAEPKLREDLLSAVELGRTQGDVFDSDQFRGLLQTDISARMQGLKMTSLLPMALIKRYIGVTAAIMAVVLVLILASQHRFKTLFLRALMPGANLETVSSTQFFIVKPKPGDQTVAQGDAVELVIELRGETAKTVKLETQGTMRGRRVAEMKPLGKNQFSAAIQVGRENVRYRMQAGDGRTRFYELTAVARPHEVSFEKTYHFPDYAKMPVKSVKEDAGNLIGLEGTEVELKITANQPLQSGELRVDRGDQTSAIPLVPMADGRLSARIALSASGTYRLHLVSAQTGFESKFSPEYELRAEPDLPPTVELDEPQNDLVSPANELVKIKGRASDDIGLARIAQMVKVNEGEWKEFVFFQDVGKSKVVEREWDLAEEGVKANDLIMTKLVATDSKGRKAESRPLRIVVMAAATEMKRLGGLESRRALLEAVKAVAAAGVAFEKAAGGAQAKFSQTENGEPRRQALAACATAFADCEAKLGAAWTALNVPLRDAPANHESADLVLLGRMLSRLHSGEVLPAGKLVELLAANPATPLARELVDTVHALAERAKNMTALAEDFYVVSVSAEQIDVVAEMAMVLSTEQNRIRSIALAATAPETWGKVATRLHAVLKVSKNLDAVLKTIKDGGGPIAPQANDLLNSNFFAWSRDKMEDALTTEPLDERMMPVFADFTKYFGEAVQKSISAKMRLAAVAKERLIANGKLPFGGDLTPVELMASMHQFAAEELEPTWRCVERLRQEQAEIAKLAKLPAEERKALAEARWNAASDIFKAHADLEEDRAAADSAYLGDLRRATVATQSVLVLSHGDGAEKTAARLEVLDQSMRILEGGHDLQEVVDGLAALGTLDRWEVRMPHARTAAPRDWGWLALRLQMAPPQLRRLGLKDAEARKAVDAATGVMNEIPASPAFKAAMFEMGERRKFKHTPESSRAQLEQIAAKVQAALAHLRNPMDAARKNLAKLTPSITDLALALAKEEAALKKDSNQLSAKVATAKPADNQAEARPQLARQQDINGRIETLKDLIRADASEQNILKKDQRERMRDADDALAMLKDPPPQAEQALRQTTEDSQATEQLADLDRAVEQEQKIVDALMLIAKNFALLDQGQTPEATREELRKAEEELGIKGQLDKEFAKAEKLAAMEGKSAEDLLKELEAKLPTNPEMRKKLDQITNDALAAALEELGRAAKAEAAAAKKVDEQIVKDRDPKTSLTALEAARLAATYTKEASAAAQAARQVLEPVVSVNKPAFDRTKATDDHAALAVPQADLLVEAAQRLQDSRKVEDIVVEANAVIQKAALMINPSNHAQAEGRQAAEMAKAGIEKGGPHQAAYVEAAEQTTRTAEKSALAIAAAQQAEAAARAAIERALAMAKIPDTAPQNPKLALASLDQQPVKSDASEAATDLGRAGRHEERLGKTSVAQKLSEIGSQVSKTAQNTVPSAEKALQEAKQPAEAQAPVQKASTELAEELEALKEAAQDAKDASPPPGDQADKNGKGEKPGESPSGDPAELTPAEQQELARALDALDAQLNGPSPESPPAPGKSPGKGSMPGEGPPGPPGPLPGMAKSAMASMRQSRSMKPSPIPGLPPPSSDNEKSLGGAKLQAGGQSAGKVPPLATTKKGDWGKLPKKLAEQLTKGQSEEIPAEYREAVEIYYRVIAERSKQP